MEFIAMKCPGCGADLNVEEGRSFTFCQYCGLKIMIQDEKEHVYRYIDEAEVKKAETDRMVKQMEFSERKEKAKERISSRWMKVALFATVLSAVVILASIIFSGGNTEAILIIFSVVLYIVLFTVCGVFAYDYFFNRIAVPISSHKYKKQNYSTVENILASTGFTNIKCVPLNDLTSTSKIEPGLVASITINGTKHSYGTLRYRKDASVVIMYHSRVNE